jgi:hypothetical protein
MSYEAVSLAQQRSKFTPERIQQIKDLVARGETREQIAAIIGVTVGTLQVTCSRLGISLRRPRVKLVPPKTAAGAVSQTTLGPKTGSARTLAAASQTATFTLNMKYKGQERSTALPFTPDVVSQLALEASFRNQKIGELVKDMLVSVFEKNLIQELLGE